MEFEEQEKAGYNSKGYYQFGSNCCIGCKVDRTLNDKGLWCDGCINYTQSGQRQIPEGARCNQ